MSEHAKRIRKRETARQVVRGASLVLAVLALTVWWPSLVPALSPFIAAASILTARTLHAMAWVGLVVGLVMLWRPRGFCRWFCPLGLFAEGASRLGRKLKRGPTRPPSLGRWIVWLTLGSAFLGYPVLVWLDPLGMFANAFRWAGPGAGQTAWIGVVPVAVVLAVSVWRPHLWCGHTCPLGAGQDLLARAKAALRPRQRCTDYSRQGAWWRRPLGRRTILGVGVGAVAAAGVRLTRPVAPQPLRPPGAVEEELFAGLCVRCGNCIRVCPTKIVEPDLDGQDLAGLLTPVVRFRDGYCREDCARCTTVCPSGALTPLAVEDKRAVRMGLARVDMNVCLLGEDRECAECKRWCPFGAIQYVFSETEYTLVPTIDPDKCTGCGACEVACPTRPTKAIVVTPAV